MAQLSDYAEKLILDWLLTGGSAPRPTAVYLALFTTPTDDAGGGTEIVGNGYARETITVAAASSPGGQTNNAAELIFTAEGGNWGTITHIAIYDVVTGGNSLFHGPLNAPVNITDTNSLLFPIGDLIFTLA
jgi:hypothetical protein